jgi:hypothetical protein
MSCIEYTACCLRVTTPALLVRFTEQLIAEHHKEWLADESNDQEELIEISKIGKRLAC